MELESILRKFVRFPWEVYDGRGHFKDREISDYLCATAGAEAFFKTCPPVEQKQKVLQLIASVVSMALVNGSGAEVKENRFDDLSDAEKKFLFNQTGYNPVEHSALLLIVSKIQTSIVSSSYVAAAYAFTTHIKPFVCTFDKVVAIASQSLREGSSEEKAMRTAGLLIINGLGNPSRANETAYSFLHDMLTARAIAGRMNMLVTAPQGELLEKLAKKEPFNRKDVVSTFLKLFPVSYQMHDKIFGVDVHMPFIDCLEINNECRQTTVI